MIECKIIDLKQPFFKENAKDETNPYLCNRKNKNILCGNCYTVYRGSLKTHKKWIEIAERINKQYNI